MYRAAGLSLAEVETAWNDVATEQRIVITP
jgi:hypothetical protein